MIRGLPDEVEEQRVAERIATCHSIVPIHARPVHKREIFQFNLRFLSCFLTSARCKSRSRASDCARSETNQGFHSVFCGNNGYSMDPHLRLEVAGGLLAHEADVVDVVRLDQIVLRVVAGAGVNPLRPAVRDDRRVAQPRELVIGDGALRDVAGQQQRIAAEVLSKVPSKIANFLLQIVENRLEFPSKVLPGRRTP